MTTAKADAKTTHTKTHVHGDKQEHEHITTNEREYEYEDEGVRKRCMHHGDVAAQPLCGSWRCSGAVPLSLIPLATCVIPRSVHPLNGRRCAWRRCWRIFIGRAQGFTC